MSKELKQFEGSLNSIVEYKGSFPGILSNPNYTRISTLSSKYGYEQTKKIVSYLMADKFDKGIDYDPLILAIVADKVMIDYNDLSLEDITYFASSVVAGRKVLDGKQLKKVFKYDAPTVGQMLDEYVKERDVELDFILQRRQVDIANGITPQVVSDHVKIPVPDLSVVREKKKQEPYKNIIDFCERHGYDEDIFSAAYSQQWDEDGKTTYSPSTPDVLEVDNRSIYVNTLASKFIYLQNCIISSRIPKSLEKEISFCLFNYDVVCLVTKCRENGIWGTRSPYCDAAKKVLTEDGEWIITYRFNIPQFILGVYAEGVRKIINDQVMKSVTKVYLLGMIFSLCLDLDRFEFSNTEEGRVVAEYKKQMHQKFIESRNPSIN